MSKEITKKEDVSVDTFISQAIAVNAPVETMERLFALHKEVKAEKAKEAYVQAMTVFQAECPVIKKTKKVLNKDGRTVRYMFAPIDSIVEQIKKPLSKATLSYRWEVKNENGEIRAICIVTHSLGHSESSDFSVPIDEEGYMTAPQKVASALTFAKRYSLCNALGISTGDEDTDATDVKKTPDAKDPRSRIILRLKSLGYDVMKTKESKESVEKIVKELTKLPLEEKNYSEIVDRLEILIAEAHEYDKSDKI